MKRYVLYSVPLGIMWCFVHGNVTILNFLLGSVLGLFIVLPFRKLYKFDQEESLSEIIRRIPYGIKLYFILNIEIVKASFMVAKIVLKPKIDLKPGIIAVPIRTKTDAGITAIANCITLTPGTITMDISDDRTMLYVHAIDASDPDAVRVYIRDKLEKYVLEVFE
ncbi:MAG: Na+/H+ antiporter subunit E [Methanosarcinaceae archaeon]|nr:Na+/H+ antiporter subunit E [Methanosarcinaceae archaeon]